MLGAINNTTMFWLIGAIVLFFFLTFFSVWVNLYSFSTLALSKRIETITLYGTTFFFSLVLSIWFWFKWDSVLSEDFIVIYGAVTAIALTALIFRHHDAKKLGYTRIVTVLVVIGCMGC